MKNVTLSLTRLPLLFQLLCLLNSCAYSQAGQNEFSDLMNQVVTVVQSSHLRPRVIDDSFSEDLFVDFLERVDPTQQWLTVAEIDQLHPHQLTIDDDINSGNFRFFEAVFDLLPQDFSREELFNKFLDSYLSVNDYQSDFMSPAERAAWNASFNRSLVGTGVRFEIKGDYPEITEVYVDGPAWKTERIRTGDRLLGIQTDDDGDVDFAGRSGDGVSRMLAGPEGSIVRLQLQHADGQIEVVKVTREQFALSRTTAAVFGGKSGEKIGYTRLPRFYSGNYSSATDVLADLSYLKAEAVSGIILALRNNKGGSVAEAVHIIGYFLRGGTVMQAVYRDGRHRMLPDDDPLAQYEGKLMVLVNEGSASASELTAATLQQYSRAVIVGRQTFGKGTIQRFFEIIDERTGRKMGDVKLTIGGFYAGEGYATQYRGVMPDIVLSLESPAGITGERKVKNALRIDHLPSYPGQHSPSFVAVLRQKRQDRNLLSADRREVLTLDMKPETSDREKAHWELVLLKDVDLYESFLIINDYLEVAPEIK